MHISLILILAVPKVYRNKLVYITGFVGAVWVTPQRMEVNPKMTDPLTAFIAGGPQLWFAVAYASVYIPLLMLQVLFAGLTGNAHHYIVNGKPIDIIKIY